MPRRRTMVPGNRITYFALPAQTGAQKRGLIDCGGGNRNGQANKVIPQRFRRAKGKRPVLLQTSNKKPSS
jgi:hypothetical protein